PTRMPTAANAIFLQYTAPIYVAIIGRWYLGERPLPIDWWVIAVALGGIALFFLDRLTTSGFWGNIVALASALAFASLVVFLRKERTGSPINSVILGNIIVGIAGAPFLLRAPLLQPRALWLVLVLGVLQLGLSYALYAEAIKHVTALEAMLIPMIEPVLNPVWVMLALGERPGPWAIVGGALVLGAVLVRAIVMVRRRRKQQLNHAPRQPPYSVLIVDDDELIRRGIAAVISDESDFSICGLAANEAGAVRLLERHKPDLLLLDLSLGHRDSMQFLKDIS